MLKIVDVKKYLTEFNDKASSTRDCLSAMLDTIAGGRVPDNQTLELCSGLLAELNQKYDAIYKVAEEITTSEDNVMKGLPVSEYVEIIKNSNYVQLQIEIEKAKEILKQFVEVKALADTYTQALLPYQEEAKEHLHVIADEHYEPEDSFGEITKGPDLFLRVLREENLDSDEALDMLEEISDYYSTRVVNGLARRRYYIEGDEITAYDDPIITGDNHKNEDKEKVENAEETIKAEQEKPEVVAVKDEEKKIKTISKIKKSTPSASKFEKEIKKMSGPVQFILPVMTNLGIMTVEQMGALFECMEDGEEWSVEEVENAIPALESKGYLNAYKAASGEYAYILSEYAYGCMKKQTIAGLDKFWTVSVGNFFVKGEEYISEKLVNTIIDRNQKLITYLKGMKETLDQKDFLTIQESIREDENGLSIKLFDDSTAIEAEIIDFSRVDSLDSEVTYLLIGDEYKEIVNNNNKGISFYFYHDGVVSRVINDDEKEKAGIDEAEDDGVLIQDKTIEDFETDKETGTPEQEKASGISVEGLSEGQELEKNTDREYLLALINKRGRPTENEFLEMINKLLNGEMQFRPSKNSDIVNALLLAKAASLYEDYPETKSLYNQLLLATNIGIDKALYTSEIMTEAFPDPDTAPEVLMFSAYLHALLVPGQPYDYALASQADLFLHEYELYFPSLEEIKPVFNKLNEVRTVSPTGFTHNIVAQLGDAEEGDKRLQAIQRRANELFTVASPNTRMKDIRPFYKDCFGEQSDLRKYGLEIVAENRSEEVDFVKDLLESFCDTHEGIFTINGEKTTGVLQDHWIKVNSKGKAFELDYDAKTKAYRRFEERIQVLIDWIEHIETKSNDTISIPQLKQFKSDLVELVDEAITAVDEKTFEYKNVLQWTLNALKDTVLGNATNNTERFKDLLLTGVISLDSDGIPIIDKEFNEILYFEPWRNVLRHINSDVMNVRETISYINEDNKSIMFDNLNQLRLLGRAFKMDDNEFNISDDDIKYAKKAAGEAKTIFEEKLELAYVYDQISETEKEKLLAIMSSNKDKFYDREDFGIWKQFLSALEKSIDEAATERKERLRAALSESKAQIGDGEIPQTLLEAEKYLEEDENFAVTEELINRFNNRDGEIDVDYNNILLDPDSFEEFLSPDVFDVLYEECIRHKGAELKSFGERYLISHFPKDWANQNRDNSKKLLDNWPGTTGGVNCSNKIKPMFDLLGFKTTSVTKSNNVKAEAYQLKAEPTEKSLADYRHPISAFGTGLKSPVNVILLHGQKIATQIVNSITELNLGGMTIILLDGAVDKVTRRQMCELFHNNTSGLNPFIVIDRVLLLYLALHQQTERLPILLKCTLPYTSYQPFIRGQGPTADEMFCGRVKELAAIIDPKGACVVYGGRQLGKTALLRRAECLGTKPENGRYAVYSNLVDCRDEVSMVETIVGDINRKAGVKIESCKSIKTLANRINKKIKEGKINNLLLLLDETDKVLDSMAGNRYEQLQPFVQLRQENSNSFKFVLAGLHNVCRAQHATAENGIFGQLGSPLCVKPLSPQDAFLLLSRPLRYIGFQIDRRPHLETILTKTNYYPGMLQFFGYMLVETMTTNYAKYYSAVDGNPPFTLTKDQLGAIMNSADLNANIRDRFRWTLELDERYFMLARCVALLYFYYEDKSGNWKGFHVNEIIDMAETYDVNCLKNESEQNLILLLDEMEEMGILTKTDDKHYRMRRASFVDIIGKDFESIEADIESNNKEI